MALKKDGNIFKILEIELIGNSLKEVLGLIEQRIAQGRKTFVVTPNPEFIVYAHDNPWFKKILMQSDIAIPDGIGLIWVSRLLASRPLVTLFSLMRAPNLTIPRQGRGRRSNSLKKATSRSLIIKQRISGIDLMEKLCQLAAGKGWGVYLLGGKPGIAQKTLEILQNRYPGLKGWTNSGPRLEIGNWKLEITEKLVEDINKKNPIFLFVALGMGKQEKFIWDNWGKLNVRVAMGVGGAFDYLSGRVKRAPQWVQNLGFEWLYRLLKESWRFKRQLSLLKFIWLILREKRSKIYL